MIIQESMTLKRKLEILSDAAKYDVACTSSGVDRNFFRFFFIVIFSILYSYFDICFGWQMYQSFEDPLYK